MENINYQNAEDNPHFINKISLPNSNAVLVLGILSILGCWCYGIIGLTLGIIALVLAKNSERLYIQEPGKYSELSFNNINAGKICAIIGTTLSGLMIIFYIVKLVILAAAFSAILAALPFLHAIFH